jgi:hypothetical protein
VLSSQERRIWQDVERWQAVDLEEPAPTQACPPQRRRQQSRGMDDLPAVLAAGIWISIGLILLGFGAAGLTVGAATAGGALLWRRWPLRRS